MPFPLEISNNSEEQYMESHHNILLKWIWFWEDVTKKNSQSYRQTSFDLANARKPWLPKKPFLLKNLSLIFQGKNFLLNYRGQIFESKSLSSGSQGIISMILFIYFGKIFNEENFCKNWQFSKAKKYPSWFENKSWEKFIISSIYSFILRSTWTEF